MRGSLQKPWNLGQPKPDTHLTLVPTDTHLPKWLATPLSSGRSLTCLMIHLVIFLMGPVSCPSFHRDKWAPPHEALVWALICSVSRTATVILCSLGRVPRHPAPSSGSYILLPTSFKMFPKDWRGARIYD